MKSYTYQTYITVHMSLVELRLI